VRVCVFCWCPVGGLCLSGGQGPGFAPASELLFFASPKKSSQKKGDPLPVTPALRAGATCDARSRGVPHNSLRCCAATFKQMRQVRTRSGCVLRHTRRPAPCASRHGQKGWGAYTGHRCARPSRKPMPAPVQAQRAAPHQAERSDGPSGMQAPCGCAWGGVFAGWRVCRRTHPLRELTRRGCSSAAPQARSEFHGAPRKRPDPGSPRSAAQGGADMGSPFLCLLSFGEAKESESPAGARPGLCPLPRHTVPTGNWNLTPI